MSKQKLFVNKQKINPIQIAMSLMKVYIKICIEKGYMTEEQCNDVLEEIKKRGGII